MVDKYEKYKHNIVLCFDLAATHFEEELQKDISDCCAEILKCIDKLKEYEKIGTIEEFKAFRSGDFTENLLNMGYTKGYAKAVDEFLKKCKERVDKTKIARLELFEICEIAEELKR